MAVLTLSETGEKISDGAEVINFLGERGIFAARWEANAELSNDSSQEEILQAYEHELKPYMEKNGFKSADVINVHSGMDNLEVIRQKFLKEHTHSEDEVRFFVDGEGKFFFHLDGEQGREDEVFELHCTKGDFLAVPGGYKHWFDLAPAYFVKAIRIFSNEEGWIANYTNSGIDEKYNK